ncbi:MAG: anti-sigma factor [Methylobacteriaceae bacterium]|nr:anti-sigma factor [Methylobacteriaceae bacterium]
MSGPPPMGEDDLNAFIDGRLSSERHALVARFLDEHPELAKRVEADIAAQTALRDSLLFKATEPIPARLRVANLAATRRSAPRYRLQIAAAAALLLMFGGVVGWFAHARLAAPLTAADTPLAAEAMRAHRVFVVETVHPVEVAAAQEAHLVQWLSRRLNHPLKAPDLSAQGFHLMGGRLLPANAGAAAQLMYQNDAGARLTIYLRADGDKETAFQFVQGQNASAFTWTEDGFGYAIAAQADRAQLLRIAESVYQQNKGSGEPKRPPPT